MNWLDDILLLVIGIAAVGGFFKGATLRIIQISAAVVAFSRAWELASWLRDTLLPSIGIGTSGWSSLVLVVVSFLLLYSVFQWIGKSLTTWLRSGILGIVDRLLGAVLGMLLAIYVLGYVLSFIDPHLPQRTTLARVGIEDARSTSELYDPIRNSITDLDGIKEYLLGKQ